MKFAILEIGSHQIRAEEGSVITVNRLPQKEGEKIEFPAMPKKRYRRKQGHRQEVTRVKIDKISA